MIPANEIQKTCLGCNLTKPLSRFYRRRNRPVSRCKDCHNKKSRDYYQRSHGAVRARQKAYRHHIRKNKPDVQLGWVLKSKYGMTVEERAAIIERQGGRCAICLRPEGEGQWDRLHVDHCHETNKIRGMLCGNCNRMIGIAKESTEVLAAAINYLNPLVEVRFESVTVIQ